MEPEPFGNTTTKAPRKVRFAPKGPPRRLQKSVVPKSEKIETADDNAAQAEELLRRFKDASVRGKPKVEKKLAPTQIAFGFGGGSSSIKSYGAPKSGIGINRASEGGGAYASGLRLEKEYKEPWDYYSNYPVTLPLRRPYSGNPELLDEEEFGETLESMSYDEHSTESAIELGLMEENVEPSMFFFQLPATMPMIRRPANAESNEMASSSKALKGAANKTCGLDELPAGFMGKMLVYRSGSIKLKLGDNLCDV
ncbi:uncharacterized protein LOC132277062 isoform X2 [Cornus florida]|nr:uncharacterized protein LOC132277062 isoform X2 [Cornus florida]